MAWLVDHTNDGMLGIFHRFVRGPALPASGLVEAARPCGVRLVVESRKMVECSAFFSNFFALSPILGIASCRLGCWELARSAGARTRVAQVLAASDAVQLRVTSVVGVFCFCLRHSTMAAVVVDDNNVQGRSVSMRSLRPG